MQSNFDVTQAKSNPSPEFVRMYYEHQYGRMTEIEQHRLTITNIVITLSLLAFTFGFGDIAKLTVINGIGLPIVVILSNIFAIAYIRQASGFMDIHGKRARKALETYAQELNQINVAIPWPKRGILGGRTTIQVLLHILLILTALLPVFVYLTRFP